MQTHSEFLFTSAGVGTSLIAGAVAAADRLVDLGVNQETSVLAVAKCIVNFDADSADVVKAVKMASDTYDVHAQSVAAMLGKDASRARWMGLTLSEAARASAKRVELTGYQDARR